MSKYTKDLVYIIIGSNDPSSDGVSINESYNNSHIEAIKAIANFFKSAGIDIGYAGQKIAEEAAFDIVKNGHIVFFNANPIAYLKIPKEISKKQYKILEIIKDELKEFNLYFQTLDPVSEECFESSFYEKNFVLKKEMFNIKDRG